MRRLVSEESGIALGIAMIMMVVIGVLAAGLLAFAQRDLGTVVENNQGQKAFEMAEAGVQAAKQQLSREGGANPEAYNGGSTQDYRWSRCFGLPSTSSPPCTPAPGAGMTLTNLDEDPSTNDSANVQIEYRGMVSGRDVFVAVAEGRYGDARRKLEARFMRDGAITSVPPAFFTRSDFKISGNVASQGISYFAMDDAEVGGGSISLGTSADPLKAWAVTSDPATSYPNNFNSTPRASTLPGIAALDKVEPGSSTAEVALGTRSFSVETNPRTVSNWSSSTLSPSQKIAFPFSTQRLPNDVEILRRRAQELEAENPSVDYYNDSLRLGQNYKITTFPNNTDHTTVFFYRFPGYDPNNQVVWDIALPCTDESKKAVLVVENGNFTMTGSRGGFNGTILVYGGADGRGSFTGTGGACMAGSVTATGDITLSGNFKANGVPIMTLPVFSGAASQSGLRELYE